MKRSGVMIIGLAAAMVLLGIFWLIRPGEKSAIAMGPMPSRTILSNPIERRMARDMRAWVQHLKPQEVENLKRFGSVVFTWESLKASYPAQAVLVDNYLEKMRIEYAKAFRQQRKSVPDRLVRHHYPDFIQITGSEREKKYWIITTSEAGIKTGMLQISQ